MHRHQLKGLPRYASLLECTNSKLSPQDLDELQCLTLEAIERDSELKDYLFKLHLQKHCKEMGIDQVEDWISRLDHPE